MVPGNEYRLLHAQYVLRPARNCMKFFVWFTRNRIRQYCNRFFADCAEIMLPLISIPIDALPFAAQLAGAVQSATLFRTPGYGGHLHIAANLFGQCLRYSYTPCVIGVGWLQSI